MFTCKVLVTCYFWTMRLHHYAILFNFVFFYNQQIFSLSGDLISKQQAKVFSSRGHLSCSNQPEKLSSFKKAQHFKITNSFIAHAAKAFLQPLLLIQLRYLKERRRTRLFVGFPKQAKLNENHRLSEFAEVLRTQIWGKQVRFHKLFCSQHLFTYVQHFFWGFEDFLKNIWKRTYVFNAV